MSLVIDEQDSIRQRKKRETRRRILIVARKLFVERGFSQTTIDSIAEQADISKPTFFNYFNSKNAVLDDLINEMDRQFVSYISDESHNNATTKQKLRHLMKRSATWIDSEPQLARLMLTEGFRVINDSGKSQFRMQRLHKAMATLIQEGINRSEVRTDYPVDLLVQVLFGSYLYAVLNWMSDSQYNLQKKLDQAAAFLAESISPCN